jgi:hypothetical protein
MSGFTQPLYPRPWIDKLEALDFADSGEIATIPRNQRHSRLPTRCRKDRIVRERPRAIPPTRNLPRSISVDTISPERFHA